MLIRHLFDCLRTAQTYNRASNEIVSSMSPQTCRVSSAPLHHSFQPPTRPARLVSRATSRTTDERAHRNVLQTSDAASRDVRARARLPDSI